VAGEVRRDLVKVERKSIGAQQEAAIAALLRTPQLGTAAAEAGVDEAVLRRWLKEPTFLARYRAARRAAMEDAADRLQRLADGAIEALARNLTCGVPEVEVEAARVVLAHALAGKDGPAPTGEVGKNGHAPRHGGQR
jgi:hypothetical protein